MKLQKAEGGGLNHHLDRIFHCCFPLLLSLSKRKWRAQWHNRWHLTPLLSPEPTQSPVPCCHSGHRHCEAEFISEIRLAIRRSETRGFRLSDSDLTFPVSFPFWGAEFATRTVGCEGKKPRPWTITTRGEDALKTSHWFGKWNHLELNQLRVNTLCRHTPKQIHTEETVLHKGFSNTSLCHSVWIAVGTNGLRQPVHSRITFASRL